MAITRETSVYMNGKYYRSIRELSNSFIYNFEDVDVDSFYGRVKTKLKIYKKESGDIIIVKDNRLENYLNKEKTKRKNIIFYSLDIEEIIKNCPFDWRRNMREQKQKRLERLEREKEERILRRKEKLPKVYKKKYYKDFSKKEIIYKEVANKFEDLDCLDILKELNEKRLNEVARLSQVSIGILRSLIFGLYGPSQRIEKNIKDALEKMNILKR